MGAPIDFIVTACVDRDVIGNADDDDDDDEGRPDYLILAACEGC